MEGRPYQMPKKKRPRRWLERAAIWLGALLHVASAALRVYRRDIHPPPIAPAQEMEEHRRVVAETWAYRNRIGLIELALFAPGTILVLWAIIVGHWRDATDFN